MMDQKSIENFKKIVADFRALTTKVHKDYQNKIMRTITKAAITKLSKRKKRLKQGGEL